LGAPKNAKPKPKRPIRKFDKMITSEKTEILSCSASRLIVSSFMGDSPPPRR
jgi:hypothetical protein